MSKGEIHKDPKALSSIELNDNIYARISMGYAISVDAVIASGASLSGAIDLDGFSSIAFIMPSAWTAANLTFQGCNTVDGTFVDIYDSAGNEITATAAASRAICDIPELAPFKFIKLRSGTTGTAVNQGAERTINVLMKG